MMTTFATGNILPLVNMYQVPYHCRPELERLLENILRPSLGNNYYVIKGEEGTGKTSLVVETVQKLVKTEGREKK